MTPLNPRAVNKRRDVWEASSQMHRLQSGVAGGPCWMLWEKVPTFFPLASIPEWLAGSLESLVKYLSVETGLDA